MFSRIVQQQRQRLPQTTQQMRSYATSDGFKEREQGEEAKYVHQQEQAKLKELREKEQQQQQELAKTQAEINKAEKK